MPSHVGSRTAGPTIGAEIRGKHGQVSGQVTELSVSGADVKLDLAQDHTLSHGETVTLVVSFANGKSVQADAIVRSKTEMDGYLQYGFDFVAPSAIRAKLPADLLRLFNERAAFRVEPSVEVRVSLRGAEQEFHAHGRMLDISIDGLQNNSGISQPLTTGKPVIALFG